MPLDRGDYRGSDRTTRVCRFTMLLHDQVIPFRVSYEAMDDLARLRGVREQDREKLFEELRDVIEEKAERKFFSDTDDKRPPDILITSDDFR
jgi:hypothetical protein